MAKKTKKPSQAFKDFVSKVCAEFRTTLFHGEYNMKIEYAAEDKRQEGEEGRMIAAEIDISSVYLDCTITIFPTLEGIFNDKDYRGVVEILCHELCHLLTEPMFIFAYDRTRQGFEERTCKEIRERQTQRMTNIVMNLTDYEKDFLPIFKPKKK